MDKNDVEGKNEKNHSPRKGQAGVNIPYKNPIDCLNKIELELTPEDKFDCLVKTSLELRNCVLDYTKGKVILYFNNIISTRKRRLATMMNFRFLYIYARRLI